MRLISNACTFCFLLRQFQVNIIKEEHLSSTCSLSISLENQARIIKKLVKEKSFLEADSCCFSCLLPTVICSHLKVVPNKCFNNKVIFRVLSLFYLKQDILGLVSKGIIPKAIGFDKFIKLMVSKVYIQEINTEGLLIFKLLVIDF